MYVIENKEDFEKELMALLAKVENIIDSTRTMIETYKDQPSVSGTNKINCLKLEAYKMKKISLSLVDLTQNDWEEKKTAFQRDFLFAKETIERRDTIL